MITTKDIEILVNYTHKYSHEEVEAARKKVYHWLISAGQAHKEHSVAFKEPPKIFFKVYAEEGVSEGCRLSVNEQIILTELGVKL